ncbi:MAG: hypothetical protein ACXWEY_05010 [Bacteroidia bacterium]
MNIFELEIWYDECRLCTFYTVRWDEATESETDKFFDRFDDEESEFYEPANILLRLITHNIGNKYGAIDDFFDRNKNKAQALPPKPKKSVPEIEEIGINFPLRLYCYRISESLVVLFNGGIKDARTDQESKDISLKFIEAQQFAERIQEAINDGTIIITKDQRTITDFNGNEEIFL